MKKTLHLLLYVIMVLLISICKAQTAPENNSRFWDQVSFGGNLGANFGNDFSTIIVAPQAVYSVNEFVGIGGGLTYSYSELDTNSPNILDYTSNIYGGSIIGLFNPIRELQASFDFEMLNVNRNFEDRRLDDNFWVPALFLGAGYRQGNFVIGARYDILYNDNRSIFDNAIQPFVRVLF